MNLVDTIVVKVLGEPEFKQVEGVNWWQIKVMANCYGREYETIISAPTQEQINEVKEEYKWLT